METEILEAGDILEESLDRFLIGRESSIVIGFLFPSYEFINPTYHVFIRRVKKY